MIDNTKQDNTKEVIDLLEKINRMVEKNGGDCYTNEMFKEAEAATQQEMQRILQVNKEEMEREKKRLCDKHEEEMAEMKGRMAHHREMMERERKLKEEELKIKEEFLRNEIRKKRRAREARMERRRSS